LADPFIKGLPRDLMNKTSRKIINDGNST